MHDPPKQYIIIFLGDTDKSYLPLIGWSSYQPTRINSGLSRQWLLSHRHSFNL